MRSLEKDSGIRCRVWKNQKYRIQDRNRCPYRKCCIYELLVRGYEVYVGKTTKGEIGFVAVKDGKKEYYQVAYLLATEDVIEREFGAYKDIQDNYPK